MAKAEVVEIKENHHFRKRGYKEERTMIMITNISQTGMNLTRVGETMIQVEELSQIKIDIRKSHLSNQSKVDSIDQVVSHPVVQRSRSVTCTIMLPKVT
jgi:hypothetical protein